MDNKLIQRLSETDLFASPSEEEIKGREEDLKTKPALLAGTFANELEIMKFIHEDNLAPNHRINFTPEQWVKILTNAETDSPGMLERLKEIENGCLQALIHLDSATTQDILKEVEHNG